jgi:uncharacterized protein YukE
LLDSVESQIKQQSEEIASIAQRYDGQLAHLKNQSEESASAITLDIAQRFASTESKFNQQLEKLEEKLSIAMLSPNT